MKIVSTLLAASAALVISQVAFAQVPAGAPAGTTGMCKDGTYVSADTKKGACKGHKGVKDWYAAAPAAAPAAAAPAAPAAPPPAPAAAAKAPATSMAAAPGGGPGMVWVNDTSKVYHCQGTKYYGKTKHGEYMSEADAKAKGMHADHGKACG